MKTLKCFLRKVLLVAVLIVAGGIFSPVHTEDLFSAKNGLYVGGTWAYSTLKGDFDGEDALTATNEAVLIPKVEDGTGWGAFIGGRGPEAAVELSYQQTKHDVTFGICEGEATYHIVSLDFKKYFLPHSKAQPYFLIGFNYPWLVVKDAAAGSEGGSIEVGDAKFYGIGLDVGGGISYYVHPRVALNLGVMYRWIEFISAEGTDECRDMDKSLNGSGINMTGGASFTF